MSPVPSDSCSLARISAGGKGRGDERTKENIAIQDLAGSRSKFPRHFSGRIRHGTRVNGPQFDDCIPVVNSNGIGVCYILFAVTSKLECAASERNGGTRLERGSFAFSSRANVICSSARPPPRPQPSVDRSRRPNGIVLYGFLKDLALAPTKLFERYGDDT